MSGPLLPQLKLMAQYINIETLTRVPRCEFSLFLFSSSHRTTQHNTTTSANIIPGAQHLSCTPPSDIQQRSFVVSDYSSADSFHPSSSALLRPRPVRTKTQEPLPNSGLGNGQAETHCELIIDDRHGMQCIPIFPQVGPVQ